MQRADAITDLAFLKLALEERFSYSRTNDVDFDALFGDLRFGLAAEFEAYEELLVEAKSAVLRVRRAAKG